MITKEEVLVLLEAEQAAHAAWVDSDDPSPSTDYWDAMDALCGALEDDDLPPHLYAAAEIAQSLTTIADEMTSANPPGAFWRMREALRSAVLREPPKLEPLVGLKELTTPRDKGGQGLTHRQAARVWRLLDDRDEPRADLVQQELDNPGSVLTEEYVKAIDVARLAELGFGARPKPVRPQAPPRKFASLEELIEQRVPLPQIVALKQQQYAAGAQYEWREMVLSLCVAMGIEPVDSVDAVLNAAGQQQLVDRIGPEVLTAALPTASVIEPRILETAPDESAPVATIEDQVMEMFEGGHDARSISKELGIPQGQVKAIVQARQESEEVQA